MLAIKCVEFSIVCRGVLGSVPPAPVASLGRKHRFVSMRPCSVHSPRSEASVNAPRAFARSNASLASRSKSHARTSSEWPIQTSKFALIHEAGKIPSSCGGSGTASIASLTVKRADSPDLPRSAHRIAAEIPDRSPGSTPMHFRHRESDSQSRCGPSGSRSPIARIRRCKIFRRRFRAHAAVDKADEIRQIMVAKKAVHLLLSATRSATECKARGHFLDIRTRRARIRCFASARARLRRSQTI